MCVCSVCRYGVHVCVCSGSMQVWCRTTPYQTKAFTPPPPAPAYQGSRSVEPEVQGEGMGSGRDHHGRPVPSGHLSESLQPAARSEPRPPGSGQGTVRADGPAGPRPLQGAQFPLCSADSGVVEVADGQCHLLHGQPMAT